MKGPRSRTKFVAWRLWECAACGRKCWTPGNVAHLACNCPGPTPDVSPWMRLVEPLRRVRRIFPPLEAAQAPELESAATADA